MLLDLVLKVRADPGKFIGTRSLASLQSFERGYLLSRCTRVLDYPLERSVRDRVIQELRPTFGTAEMDAYQIIQRVVTDEARAFDLFFESFDSVLADPQSTRQPAVIEPDKSDQPMPSSGFLDALATHPNMFLPEPSPRCLHAFLDGTRLASIDAGHAECADLDGFDQWIREKLKLGNIARWEDAFPVDDHRSKEDAFGWAVQELWSFRRSKGPLSERKYEVKHWREQEHTAGRPSGLEDFYHAHGLCWVCRATGISASPVDWDGEKRFYESCPVCGGTGKVSGES